MPRKPEAFVRQLSMTEGQWLQRLTRTSNDPIRLRRATIVMASAQGQSVSDIAHMFATTEGYVRKVIHDINDQGFGGLDPKWSSGPPVRITTTTRERICRIARCHPKDLGRPFTVWSLAKLADYLITQGIIDRISKETLRQILKHHGITWQATKTWKASNDPDFRQKMQAILDLYDHHRSMGMWCVSMNSAR